MSSTNDSFARASIKVNSVVWWSLFLGLIVVISIWASPFRYDYANSGRYLMVVAKRMDPALFPEDPVVSAMSNFDSLFYRLLPAALSGPEHFQTDLFKVFAGMKAALVLSLFWLIRCLAKEPLAAVLFLTWTTQTAPAVLGGVALFANVATHAEIVLVLGILAVVCALKRLYWGFWGLLCLALFFHSLMTLHLLATVLPVLLLVEFRHPLRLLLGAIPFAICFLCYIHWMTPPRFNSEEIAIFIRAKGDMQHISPLAQPSLDYLKFFLLLALANLGQRRFLPSEPQAKLLLRFAITGTIVALVLAFAATFGGVFTFMQLQPMRIFFWVTLFLYVMIAWIAAAALTEKSPMGWVFLGFILFSMAGSLWAHGCAVLGIAGMAVEQFASALRKPMNLARWSRWLLLAFMSVVVVGVLCGDREPLRSLRDPWLLIPAAGLLFFLAMPGLTQSRILWLAIILCFCTSVIGLQHGWRYAHEKNRKSGRPDWLAVCNWCRLNSAKADLFLTPPDGDNFRIHSLRSCVGENVSALAWVNPTAYQDNANTAATVGRFCKDGCWDLQQLRETAREIRAKYIVVEGDYLPRATPIFEQGSYSVHNAE